MLKKSDFVSISAFSQKYPLFWQKKVVVSETRKKVNKV